MIKLYPPQQCDVIFKNLLKDLMKENGNGAIIKKISETFGDYFIYSLNFEDKNNDDFRVYRFVPEHPKLKKDPNDISNYSYNPTPRRGRANLENNPVFYCSFEPLTAIEETKKLGTENYYISTWRIKKRFDAFLLIYDTSARTDFLSEKINNKLTTQLKSMGKKADWYKYQQKKITDLFTYEGDKFYNISSAIAHNLLYSSRKQGINVPVIIYPSVSKNHTEYNFAIHPTFVNNPDLFELVSVVKCKMKHTNNGLSCDIFSKAIITESKLKWGNINADITDIDYTNIKIAGTKSSPWTKCYVRNLKIKYHNNYYSVQEFLTRYANKWFNMAEGPFNINGMDIYNSEIEYYLDRNLFITSNSEISIVNKQDIVQQAIYLNAKISVNFKN